MLLLIKSIRGLFSCYNKIMKFKKIDYIIIIFLLIFAFALYGYTQLAKSKGGEVVVKINGEEVGSYPLSQDTTVVIGDDESYNILKIENGKASISEASCPDKLCVKMGEISLNTQSVVCLPNKLIIEIRGGEEADVDSIN